MAKIGIGGITLTGTEESIVTPDVTLPAMVYRPNTAGRAPAVVICSGGMETGMFEVYEWIAASLRDAGIFAIVPKYRAASPLHDSDDISLVVDWLGAQPGVDSERIGIMGHSRGGTSALRSAALDSRLKAVVTFGAVTNFLQQLEGLAVYAPARGQKLIQWLGDPVANRSFYEEIQAMSYGARIKQPLLMLHGQNDMHAPVEQSEWMRDAIVAGGNNDVRLEIIPKMGHYADMIPNQYGFDILRSFIVPYFLQKLHVLLHVS
jgi:dipeptidyl aminopeptidase/acylaminoacyl peptidase